MPLEIDEIGIRMAVGSGSDSRPAAPAEEATGVALTPAQHEVIVNACTQQVLRTLRTMQER
jgi:hypothetical protein